MTNVRNFGRNKNYTHGLNVTYTVPLKQIPFLDWMTVKASYNSNYSWSAAALNLDSLGNVIQNGNGRQLNADLNFEKLYNKSKYLKKINSGAKKRKGATKKQSRNTNDKEESTPGKKKDDKKKKKDKEPSKIARAVLRPLMLIRKGRVTYSENYSSVVPGFTPASRVLGQTTDFAAPGWEYIAGFRPSDAWLDDAAANNWITDNIYLNQQVLGSYTQNFDARLTIEPFKDFRLEIDATRTYSENHTEFFKVQNAGGTHQHLTPRGVGSYTVSFFAMNTLFVGFDNQNFVSETFKKFEANRAIISQRTGNSATSHPTDGGDYTQGFGRFQQDVLIPAFIAAYTDADPNTIDLNLFDRLPAPNWRLTYNGLSKVDAFKKVFKTFNLSHSYKSTDYAINKNINIRLFYDRSQTIPATSASFPITNTQAGLTIRYALN